MSRGQATRDEKGARGEARGKDTRLDGNRVWRVDTPRGTVLQKLYAERGGWLHAWGRDLGTRLQGAKTGTRAAARRATERRLLETWRAHGCDAPADLSSLHPDLANERTLVIEYVEGSLLDARLRDPSLADPERAALLSAFGASWGRRHRLALERREPALLQEHGTLQHVIVAGPAHAPRFVTFDHENAFASPRVEGCVAKEVASVLPSLYRAQPRAAKGRRSTEARDARFREDLRALLAGYGDLAPLRAACAYYLRPRGPLWRAVWRVDRIHVEWGGVLTSKYRMLELLDEVLAQRAVEDRDRSGPRRVAGLSPSPPP